MEQKYGNNGIHFLFILNPSQWLYALLWLAVPVYLLWMQQRVYGGNKALTVLRYLAIGGVYLFLVSFVVMYAVLAGISA